MTLKSMCQRNGKRAAMTDGETYIYAFTSCHGDAYFGSFAELKDHAVIGPVSVVGPFVDERAAADHGSFQHADVGDR
jgi:hypothetical protein